MCSALAPREGENVKEFDDLLSVQWNVWKKQKKVDHCYLSRTEWIGVSLDNLSLYTFFALHFEPYEFYFKLNKWKVHVTTSLKNVGDVLLGQLVCLRCFDSQWVVVQTRVPRRGHPEWGFTLQPRRPTWALLLPGERSGEDTAATRLWHDESGRCPICLGCLSEKEVGFPESCSHVFCVSCILKWAEVCSKRSEYCIALSAWLHSPCEVRVDTAFVDYCTGQRISPRLWTGFPVLFKCYEIISFSFSVTEHFILFQ